MVGVAVVGPLAAERVARTAMSITSAVGFGLRHFFLPPRAHIACDALRRLFW